MKSMRAILITVLAFLGTAACAAEVPRTPPEEIRPDLAGKTNEVNLNNIRTVRVYDDKGFVTSKVERSADGRESKWIYTYDMLGRLITLLNPDQSQMLYEYPDDKSTKPKRIKLIDAKGREQAIL